MKYNAIFLLQTNNYRAFGESRLKWLIEMSSNGKPWLNKYAFVEDIGIPDGILHVTPIFDEHEFDDITKTLKEFRGTKLDSLIISQVIIGEFCYRNHDYSATHKLLEKEYGIKLKDSN